jgi:hypothetical protein
VIADGGGLRMSKQPQWTEGPWHVSWGADKEGERYFDILKSDGDADDDGRMVDASYSIVEMAYPVTDDETESKANAQLMAAAPELYEALEALLPWVRTEGGYRLNSKLEAAIRRADMTLAWARDDRPAWDTIDEEAEWGPDTAQATLERGPR